MRLIMQSVIGPADTGADVPGDVCALAMPQPDGQAKKHTCKAVLVGTLQGITL